tara:strand:- start:5112 stop:5972 length:861 start_codon:yes stop_codon:yes gene_type:complete
MGFKAKANARRKAATPTPRKLSEEEAISFVTEQLHKYNDNVRGFQGRAGSCITDSMLFCKVYNRLFTHHRAKPVCTDLSAQAFDNKSPTMQVCLWHKGHDGNDPHYPDARTNPRYYGNTPSGYDGHIIVQTQNYYVDLTLGQINRPALKVPLSHTFARTEAKAFSLYHPNIRHFFTEVRHTQIINRTLNQQAGQPLKNDAKITHSMDLVLLRPESLAPEAVAIQDYNHDDRHSTTIAWAIRTDIDFETELGIHRQYFHTNDTWYDERKIHGRGLYAQCKKALKEVI